MSVKPTPSAPKKKQPAAMESSLTIAEQTEAFLKAGGSIQHIKTGVTGQQNLIGPKQITLGSKPKA
jgi:hypothetical protein